MEHYRYGSFKLCNHWLSLIVILVFLSFSIVSVALNLSIFFVIFPAVCAFIRLFTILKPYFEKISIDDESITICFGNKRTISIPKEITLVVSYADICSPFMIRTVLGNETEVLKDRYALTILHKLPLDTILKTLHRNRIIKYTSSTIKESFDEYQYIYSFVCNQELLNRIISNRQVLLIIPQSLSNKVDINVNKGIVYRDFGH